MSFRLNCRACIDHNHMQFEISMQPLVKSHAGGSLGVPVGRCEGGGRCDGGVWKASQILQHQVIAIMISLADLCCLGTQSSNFEA